MDSKLLSAAIWNSIQPTSISLDSKITGAGSNVKYKIILNANANLYHSIPSVLAFFHSILGDLSSIHVDTIWFISANGHIIHWNLPVNVNVSLSNIDKGKEWELTMKIGNYPYRSRLPITFFPMNSRDDEVLPSHQPLDRFRNNSFEELTFIETHWLNRIKEACFLLNGNSNIIMTMSQRDSQLWYKAIIELDGDLVSKYFSKLIPLQVKTIPIILYNNEKTTRPNIRQLLGENEFVDTITLERFLLKSLNASPICKVCDIKIPNDIALLELYKLMKSIDGFLHICVYTGTSNAA